MKKAFLLVGIAILVFGGSLVGIFGYIGWNFSQTAPSQDPQELVYEVMPGKAFNKVATELQERGVVKNAELFSIYARVKGQRRKLKAGEYQLNTGMKPAEVLDVITSGKSIARAFTISEGLSTYEIALAFERQGFGTASEFFALTRDAQLARSLLGEDVKSLEGYLFPETYMLTKFTDARTLITSMVKRFLVVYGEAIGNKPTMGLTRHQVVTLASIIEKETGAPEERPLISSVFHNRLTKRMRLQTDPTVIYGKAELMGRIVISITKADLTTLTPYNTYMIPALPPGPIANPGRESLVAAIQPETSSYLYFVSQNDGTHVFSTDYKSHTNAVRKFQLNRKAREGKSWRDLKSRK